MKYRRLTKEQLEELHPEFINFLATQSITAEEWDTLKKEKPEVAEEEIDVFSDLYQFFQCFLQFFRFPSFRKNLDFDFEPKSLPPPPRQPPPRRRPPRRFYPLVLHMGVAHHGCKSGADVKSAAETCTNAGFSIASV